MLVVFYDTIMKDVAFDGIQHAEEIFFRSKFSEKETKDFIKKKLAIPYGYYDNSTSSDRLLYTKKRLFICDYNLHCDIQMTDNRYRIRLYYTKANMNWTYFLPIILFLLLSILIGSTKIFAHSSDITTGIVALVVFLISYFTVKNNLHTNPTNELREACRNIKKELEASVKLELEP